MATAMRDLIATCATRIQSCSVTKNLKKLKQVHAQAITMGISCNEFIRAKLVHSYSSCGQMYEASCIFYFSNRRQAYLYNSLIRGFASVGLFPQSLSCFRLMLADSKSIECHTLPVVLKACTGLCSLHLGKQIHWLILANGFSSDAGTLNALITMYSKGGDLGAAKKLFDRMPVKNTVTWSAMMAGYCVHGRIGEVFLLFEEMLSDGVTPDAVTFTAVLTACCHGGMPDKGNEYFEMMKGKYGIRPEQHHYTCMVDMLGKAGRLVEAEALVNQIDVLPDRVLAAAILSAFVTRGKMVAADGVAAKICG